MHAISVNVSISWAIREMMLFVVKRLEVTCQTIETLRDGVTCFDDSNSVIDDLRFVHVNTISQLDPTITVILAKAER